MARNRMASDPKLPESPAETETEPMPQPAPVTEPGDEPAPLAAERVPEGVIRAPNPTPHLPKPGGTTQPGQRLLLASIMKEDVSVMMMVPRRLILTLDDHTQVEIPSGPQKIPARLADHWYLNDCGVTRL